MVTTEVSFPGVSGAVRTVDEERLHRKQRLAGSFRLFGRFGFDEGVAGHITARDPELLDHFWVNPFGRSFKQMRVSDLLLVNHDGAVVEGIGLVNGAAFAIHSQVHAARPDVIAAAHSHSLYGKAWSSLGRRLDPITQDACAFYGDHSVFDDFTGVVLDVEVAVVQREPELPGLDAQPLVGERMCVRDPRAQLHERFPEPPGRPAVLLDQLGGDGELGFPTRTSPCRSR